MFDAIPRVALLRDAGVETVDRWIVPATDLEVARELLELAGVPHDRLHALRRSDHVVCDELVVTSAPGEICEPTPRTVEALRTMLDPGGLRLAQRSGERNVYIARRGRRRVANERELASILERRGFELVAMEDADSVVCTGLFDDRTETPEDYSGLLNELEGRKLPFICANPDIVVEMGDRLLWCAGALARDYSAMGGETFVAGKPYAPIYEAAFGMVAKNGGAVVPRKRFLAIGDGMPTDVRVAAAREARARKHGRP
jgi:hypothetical protein